MKMIARKRIQQKQIDHKYEEVIDNFIGLPKIRNYCIMSIKDNGYNLVEESVGVLQCYNKSNMKKIDKYDLMKIEQLGKFIGGLTCKASELMIYYSLIIGVLRLIDQPEHHEHMLNCMDF